MELQSGRKTAQNHMLNAGIEVRISCTPVSKVFFCVFANFSQNLIEDQKRFQLLNQAFLFMFKCINFKKLYSQCQK